MRFEAGSDNKIDTFHHLRSKVSQEAWHGSVSPARTNISVPYLDPTFDMLFRGHRGKVHYTCDACDDTDE